MQRNYPSVFKSLPIWILWKIEQDQNSRATKIPYSANYFGKASSNKSNTWASYESACREWERLPDFYNGIGIAVSKEHSIIFTDIDHCIDVGGNFNNLAKDIISTFKGQYIEVSQSGSGIHILSLGTIPKSFKNSNNGVEMYSSGRFCSLTGNTISDGIPHLDQEACDKVFQKYKKKDKPKVERISLNTSLQNGDSWVIEHASKNSKFADLMAGNWQKHFSSQSEADLSFCSILAFWTNCDESQIDRIFRTSGLYREKWNRADYKDSTIKTASECCRETIQEYAMRKRKEDAILYEQAITSAWEDYI